MKVEEETGRGLLVGRRSATSGGEDWWIEKERKTRRTEVV